jgi:RNA 2',3'-cyclic 3'-phosphodiesterase
LTARSSTCQTEGANVYTFFGMRLFVGLPLAAPVVNELAAISLRYRTKEDGLRWSTPESWHITLQFLGNTGQPQYDCIIARLRELRSPPVPVRLEETGFFDRAGIFFTGVALSHELLALQQQVTAATGLCGFIPEDRPYRPHITLARSRGRRKTPGLEILKARLRHQPRFPRFVAEEFLLYESFTRPTGSEYEIRERFRLEGR